MRKGDQIWDLNPLVFYRLKKPVQNLDSLPKVKISQVYNQNRKEMRKLVIIERIKNISDEQIRLAQEKADDLTKHKID